MAFSGMINVKTGQLTLGGQFEAYKRGQLERNIQFETGDNSARVILGSSPFSFCFFFSLFITHKIVHNSGGLTEQLARDFIIDPLVDPVVVVKLKVLVQPSV